MARTLREGGVPEAMVRAFVEALREALSQVATKEDVQTGLAGVESRVMGEISKVWVELANMRTELANMRTEFHRTMRVHLLAVLGLGVAFFAFLRG